MDENTSGASSGQSSGATSSGNITSGTASEAMIKAATASSADTGASGDTSSQAGAANPGAAAAIAQPGKTGQPSGQGNRGPIPLDRHEAILRNAREQTAQLERQLSWAKEFKPEQVPDIKVALQLLTDLRRDPQAFYRELASLVDKNGNGSQPEGESFPEPDLVSEDGRLKTYSDRHILGIRQQLMDEIKELRAALTPLQESFLSTAEERASAAERRAADSRAAEVLSKTRQLPHFKENEAAILEHLQAIPIETVEKVGAVGALYMAYNQFLSEQVFPTIETTAEARVRDSFARKANTSRGQAHPTDQGGDGRVPEIKGPEQLAAHMRRLEQTMTQ